MEFEVEGSSDEEVNFSLEFSLMLFACFITKGFPFLLVVRPVAKPYRVHPVPSNAYVLPRGICCHEFTLRRAVIYLFVLKKRIIGRNPFQTIFHFPHVPPNLQVFHLLHGFASTRTSATQITTRDYRLLSSYYFSPLFMKTLETSPLSNFNKNAVFCSFGLAKKLSQRKKGISATEFL